MDKFKVVHDTVGHTLTVWFDDPSTESIGEETTEGGSDEGRLRVASSALSASTTILRRETLVWPSKPWCGPSRKSAGQPDFVDACSDGRGVAAPRCLQGGGAATLAKRLLK